MSLHARAGASAKIIAGLPHSYKIRCSRSSYHCHKDKNNPGLIFG